MLTYYQQQTQRLLQNPAAPTSLYATADLTSYINTMRGQLAGDGQCIRRTGTLTVTIGQRNYNFSDIVISDPSVAGVLNVRRILYGIGIGAGNVGGNKYVTPRPWEWFELYALNNPVPDQGAPKMWSQEQQGSAGTGSITNKGAGTIITGTFWIDPLPDFPYVLSLECACYPIALAADTDAEAIPYIWTDAVPFGAAWYALLSSQTSARMQDAEKYLSYYQMYAERARRGTNPDVLKYQYEQQPNITLPNLVGLTPKGPGR